MPKSKLNFFSDDEDSSDSGFGSSPETTSYRKKNTQAATKSRKRLFSCKRKATYDDDTDLCCTSPPKRMSIDKQDFIMMALERMESSDQGLIGDASSKHSLPTITGKHKDLPSIDAATVSSLLNSSSSHTIIDCRYPYEYQGGHIQGAINIYTEEGIRNFMETRATGTHNDILVFHCEFSSHRGPKL